MSDHYRDFYSTSLDTKIEALRRLNAAAPTPLGNLFEAICDGAGGTSRVETDTHDGLRRSVMVLASEGDRVTYAVIVHDAPADPEERAINGDQLVRATWVTQPNRPGIAEDFAPRLASVAVAVDECEQSGEQAI